MNNTTDFYFCSVEGQPVKFRITEYQVKFKNGYVLVKYEKQIFNSDRIKVLSTIDKSYKIKNTPEKLDANLDVIEDAKNDFDLIMSNPKEEMEKTLDKILRLNGLEGVDPMV